MIGHGTLPLVSNSTQSQNALSQVILHECGMELEEIMKSPIDGRPHSLEINMLNMLNYDPDIGIKLIMNPKDMSLKFDAAIMEAQNRIISLNSGSSADASLLARPNITCRYTSLPQCPGLYHRRIPGVEVLGRLISVRGVVTRLGPVRLMEKSRTWSCAKCNSQCVTLPEDTLYGTIPKPLSCLAMVEDGRCGGTKFDEYRSTGAQKMGSGEKEDYQEIRIQEMTSLLEVGALPRNLNCILRGDCVDRHKAGDEVIATGWMICRWKPGIKSEMLCESEFALVVNNINLVNRRSHLRLYGSLSIPEWSKRHFEKYQRLIGRNHLISAFCPQIYGLFLVKLAVLLTIVGGSDEDGASSTSTETKAGARSHRKEGHLLLVGDPGTAKSQFLVSAAKLVTRSVITTGSGSTNAGLTVAAVKESGEWQLEAGALVMADRGICCIDEFNGLRGHDRTAIHEAMEQQTLSVAKAGLVCKLNTRCSIIAACNSKGKFEEGESISTNVAIASPLISRFDLILVMTDKHLPEWDQSLSTSILEAASKSTTRSISRPWYNDDDDEEKVDIDFDTLKAFTNYVRADIQPALSIGARIVLGKYYQRQRKADFRDAARTTIRLLESLVRLAQAHAKLCHSETVEMSDAIWAVILMETSLSTQTLLDFRADLYAPAPADPLAQYAEYEQAILRRLEINPRVLEESDDLTLPLEDSDTKEVFATWAPTQKTVN